MTNSSNYMNDFHYETILPQSADAYGSVTNFKRFSQPSRKGSVLQKFCSKEYFREKHDWFVNRFININKSNCRFKSYHGFSFLSKILSINKNKNAIVDIKIF